jgi:hypothetical protein
MEVVIPPRPYEPLRGGKGKYIPVHHAMMMYGIVEV